MDMLLKPGDTDLGQRDNDGCLGGVHGDGVMRVVRYLNLHLLPFPCHREAGYSRIVKGSMHSQGKSIQHTSPPLQNLCGMLKSLSGSVEPFLQHSLTSASTYSTQHCCPGITEREGRSRAILFWYVSAILWARYCPKSSPSRPSNSGLASAELTTHC